MSNLWLKFVSNWSITDIWILIGSHHLPPWSDDLAVEADRWRHEDQGHSAHSCNDTGIYVFLYLCLCSFLQWSRTRPWWRLSLVSITWWRPKTRILTIIWVGFSSSNIFRFRIFHFFLSIYIFYFFLIHLPVHLIVHLNTEDIDIVEEAGQDVPADDNEAAEIAGEWNRKARVQKLIEWVLVVISACSIGSFSLPKFFTEYIYFILSGWKAWLGDAGPRLLRIQVWVGMCPKME